MPILRLCGGDVGDRALVEQDVAGIGREKAGDQVERRGLARAARAQQRHECAGRNVERDLVDRRDRPERLGEIAQPELGSARLCGDAEVVHSPRRRSGACLGELRSAHGAAHSVCSPPPCGSRGGVSPRWKLIAGGS